MTDKKPKQDRKPTWNNSAPPTLGDIIGEQLRAKEAKDRRRAELDAAGFRPLKVDE